MVLVGVASSIVDIEPDGGGSGIIRFIPPIYFSLILLILTLPFLLPIAWGILTFSVRRIFSCACDA